MSVPRTAKLGEEEITRIGLGTNRLSNTAEHQSFVREAVETGIDFIDTAYRYAGGESEQTLGAVRASGTDGALIATKGGMSDARPEALREEIEESLRRLQVEAIDLYYLHRVDEGVGVGVSLSAIKEYVDAGKIRHVGVSEVGIDQIERGQQVVPIAAVQNHYNLTERRWEGVVDYCESNEILFVPFFPLRGESAVADELARERGATSSQITLAWMLRRSDAIAPIPGTLSIEHVRENLASLDIELSDEEFEALG